VNDPAMTYRQARAHFESMTVTVVWDDGSSAQLVRHEIFPIVANAQSGRILTLDVKISNQFSAENLTSERSSAWKLLDLTRKRCECYSKACKTGPWAI
jgi:hypothetical protein